MTVSILLPVQNNEQTIEQTIEEMLYQSFDNFELIILHLGSSDNSGKLIRSFKDKRIRILMHESNYTNACNDALNIAKGKYILKIEPSDILNRKMLEKQVHHMESNPNIIACGVLPRYSDNLDIWNENIINHNEIPASLIVGNPSDFNCFMMEKQVLIQNQLKYNNSYVGIQEYELCAELLGIGELAIIPEFLILHIMTEKRENQINNRNVVLKSKEIKNEVFKFLITQNNIPLNLDEPFTDEIFNSIKYHLDQIKNTYTKEIMYDVLRGKIDNILITAIQEWLI